MKSVFLLTTVGWKNSVTYNLNILKCKLITFSTRNVQSYIRRMNSQEIFCQGDTHHEILILGPWEKTGGERGKRF